MQKKSFYNDNLLHLNPTERRLINPHFYKVDISDDLYDTKMRILDTLNREIREFKL